MEQKEKTALVLASGGVFGAYHVGVWKALADAFQPDLVVGASIGSVNGWLIAGGCPPEELEELWLNSQSRLQLRPRIPRHWSRGIFDLAPLESFVKDILGRYTPRVEYAAVVTEVPSMQSRLFTAGEMTWEHMLASCAVPIAFDLRRIDGSFYADGGLLSAAPLWAAAALGATRIVAVRSLPAPPGPLRLARSALQTLSRFRPPSPPAVEMVMIEPERPLGSFLGMLRYSPELIRDWIEQGERDALRVKHSITECFERQ